MPIAGHGGVYPRSPISIISHAAAEQDHSMEVAISGLCGRPDHHSAQLGDEFCLGSDCRPVQETHDAAFAPLSKSGQGSAHLEGQGQGDEKGSGKGSAPAQAIQSVIL